MGLRTHTYRISPVVLSLRMARTSNNEAQKCNPQIVRCHTPQALHPSEAKSSASGVHGNSQQVARLFEVWTNNGSLLFCPDNEFFFPQGLLLNADWVVIAQSLSQQAGETDALMKLWHIVLGVSCRLRTVDELYEIAEPLSGIKRERWPVGGWTVFNHWNPPRRDSMMIFVFFFVRSTFSFPSSFFPFFLLYV